MVFKLFWSALPHSKCLWHNPCLGSAPSHSILITLSKCYPQEFTPRCKSPAFKLLCIWSFENIFICKVRYMHVYPLVDFSFFMPNCFLYRPTLFLYTRCKLSYICLFVWYDFKIILKLFNLQFYFNMFYGVLKDRNMCVYTANMRWKFYKKNQTNVNKNPLIDWMIDWMYSVLRRIGNISAI